jgi:hypothetical protein
MTARATRNEADHAPLGPALDVSVVIPLYDKAPYVARALNSALAQTLAPREVIVVDDGSQDDGPAIVERMSTVDPRIQLIRQANAGPSAARNRGIAEAKGTWIAFLDADDVLLPRYLERAARLAGLHPEADVLTAAYREVPEGLQEEVARSLADEAEAETCIASDFFKRWQTGAFFFTSSAIVRKSALANLAPAFPKGEKLGEDHDLWFRLVERGPIAWTANIGTLYTVGIGTSITGGSVVTDPLPSYARLKSRLERADFPSVHREAAVRLVATHWLNIARARAQAGDQAGARVLLDDPVTRHRPIYRLRSAAIVWASALLGRPVRLGRI